MKSIHSVLRQWAGSSRRTQFTFQLFNGTLISFSEVVSYILQFSSSCCWSAPTNHSIDSGDSVEVTFGVQIFFYPPLIFIDVKVRWNQISFVKIKTLSSNMNVRWVNLNNIFSDFFGVHNFSRFSCHWKLNFLLTFTSSLQHSFDSSNLHILKPRQSKDRVIKWLNFLDSCASGHRITENSLNSMRELMKTQLTNFFRIEIDSISMVSSFSSLFLVSIRSECRENFSLQEKKYCSEMENLKKTTMIERQRRKFWNFHLISYSS